MAKINREEIIGNHYQSKDWGKFVILSYEGKDDKNKHWYKIIFKDTQNEELVHWDTIRKGTAIDSRTRKLNKAKVEQIRLKQRNRLTKAIKEDYNLDSVKTKKTLVIDLSTTATGVTYVNNGKIYGSKLVRSDLKDFRARGYKIIHEILQMLKKGKIECVVIEGVFLGLNSNILSCLSEVRGMLSYHLQELEVELVLIPATKWKSFHELPTTRNEQKKAAMDLYYKWTGQEAETDDVADSYCLAKYCLGER